MEEIKALDTEIIGDKVVNKDDVTPSTYFEYVKGMKNKLNKAEYNIIIDTALKMINKCKITKQTAMAKELTRQVELALKELEAANKGFDIYVNRKDIEKYIMNVEGKAIKIIELSEYSREIPDENIDKISEAVDIFDEMYIIFTDYTKSEAKKVAKERRDKDPIVFGAFLDKDSNNDKAYVEDRLFFITDWVDDKCDLTLEQIVRDTKGKENEVLLYKVSNPEDEEKVKAYLKSFKEPIENKEPYPPENIFNSLKNTIGKLRKGSKKRSEDVNHE